YSLTPLFCYMLLGKRVGTSQLFCSRGVDMYSVTLEENSPLGTLVVKVNASDLDDGKNGNIIYSFGESVQNKISELFHLDTYNGEITVNGVIDFEQKDLYEFDVKASDRGNVPRSSFCTVLIQIKDMNDNAPQIDITSLSSSVLEDVKPGSVVGIISITDLDSGFNSKIACTISEKLPFEINKKSKIPVLVLHKGLDRELKSKYDFVLSAVDGGNPPRSGNMNITVMVADFNDNAPVFVEQMYSVILEENAPLGTVVVKVNASDLDEGSNGYIVYSFGDSVQNKISELFRLDIYTGEITVNGVIDFEEKEMYEFDVKASDNGNVPMSSFCTVLVQIKDVNDNAPHIEITSLSSSVFEDVKPGSVVGVISITDLDSGFNSKIACTISEKLPFEIKPSIQENLYSLTTHSRLDREFASQFNITVIAKDFGHPSLSSYKTVLVNVLDVNDNNPKFLQNPYVFFVEENNTPGASIFTVSAVDEDTHENALITYYLWENEAAEKQVVPFLSINSNNGQVTTFTSFDFEQMKSFTFSVVAKDSGVPSLSSNVTVNVFILDQNDNPPLVLFPFSTNGTAVAEETIPRNVKTGYLVTRIRAYDADVGYNALLSFSLEEATDSSLFRVGRYTGEIRTLRAIAEEIKSKYDLVLSAVDGGNPPRSGKMNITVMVADFNDNSPVFLEQIYSVTLEENAPLGTLVVKMNASDLDEGSNGYIVYSFGNSVHNKISELFHLDIYTGGITVNGVIDFEEKEFYEFDVKASDNGNVPMSSFCTVMIQIKDMNDNAPQIDITSLSSSVFEDVKPGSVIGVISITDLDSGFNSKISCTISENMPFEIKPSIQENLYSLTTHSRLDRESASQYNITIIAKDFGHPSLSSYKTVLVNVLDVNDNRPKFLQNPYVFFVDENNTPGASIFTVGAVDEDTHENALITYYLWENEAAEKQVVPFLTNGTAVAEETIPRNVKASYLVTRIRAYDADVGYNALLSFYLEEATDSSLFIVGRYTGEIRTLRAIAESDVTVHKMVVLVKDSGSISLSASVTVIVTTAENTEAHALSEIKSTTTREEPGNKTTFYLIIVLGSVSSLFIITIIALIAFQCHKTYHGFISNKYFNDTNYAEVSGSLFHSHHYQTAKKRLVLIGPEMNREGMVDKMLTFSNL
uniref:Protocadherin 2 alpha a 1 n=1 Tax=Erpetoichthys calabaricus TaxID=27687 RepID=A0A8C4SHA8_ERPCA